MELQTDLMDYYSRITSLRLKSARLLKKVTLEKAGLKEKSIARRRSYRLRLSKFWLMRGKGSKRSHLSNEML